MKRAWLVVLAAWLALPATAQAHIVPMPPFVTAAADTAIALESPNERADSAMTGLMVELPTDIVLVGAAAPPGWRKQVSGQRASFTGGTLSPGATLDFGITVRATRAGTSKLRSTQRFEDGREVGWDVDVSVLPASAANAPDQHLGRALLAGSVGVFAVALSLLAVHRLRRRPL